MTNPALPQPREQIEGADQAVHLRTIQQIGDEGGVQLAVATILSENPYKRPWYTAIVYPQIVIIYISSKNIPYIAIEHPL